MEIMTPYSTSDDGGGMIMENGEVPQKRQRVDTNPNTAEWAT